MCRDNVYSVPKSARAIFLGLQDILQTPALKRPVHMDGGSSSGDMPVEDDICSPALARGACHAHNATPATRIFFAWFLRAHPLAGTFMVPKLQTVGWMLQMSVCACTRHGIWTALLHALCHRWYQAGCPVFVKKSVGTCCWLLYYSYSACQMPDSIISMAATVNT